MQFKKWSTSVIGNEPVPPQKYAKKYVSCLSLDVLCYYLDFLFTLFITTGLLKPKLTHGSLTFLLLSTLQPRLKVLALHLWSPMQPLQPNQVA